MGPEIGVVFRTGTPAGPVLHSGSVIQVLAGAYPDHPRVVVTGVTYTPGESRCEPVEGCYAVAYPSMDGEYPLVSMSGAEMPDAETERLLEACFELAEQMARWAYHLILRGEAHVIPVWSGARRPTSPAG